MIPVDKICLRCNMIEFHTPSATTCICGGKLIDYDADDPKQEITKFNKVEMGVLRKVLTVDREDYLSTLKPINLTDREWKEFLGKLQ